MKKETNAKKGIGKKILIVILIILILIVICITRKFIILSKIESISKERVESTNFYVETCAYNSGNLTIRRSFNKDSDYLTVLEFLGKNINEERKIAIYKKGNDNLGLIKSGENKIAITDNELVGGKSYVRNGINGVVGFNKLMLAAFSKITSTQINSKDCYLIQPYGEDLLIYVEKETGLLVREVNGIYITDYNYMFNVVTDENLKKPDITGYEIKD